MDYSLDERFRRRIWREGWCTHPLTLQVLSPERNAEKLPETKDWHHDDAGYRSGFRFIVWSNTRPTEVRFADGTLLETKDGDVILIDNDEVEHRAPADQAGRWFVRTGLAVHIER